jgi:hypothetical protein
LSVGHVPGKRTRWRTRAAIVSGALGWSIAVLSRPAGGTGPSRPSSPPELPFLATLPHVRVGVARDHAIVVFDLNLPQGQWQSGDLDLFVAFGAPGAPRAIDARLFGIAPPQEPSSDEAGEPIVMEAASRRPLHAFALLGQSRMTGVVIHLREAAFRRGTAGGRTARLRIRELYDLPAAGAQVGREVVVRLGSEGGAPLVLDDVVVGSLEPGSGIGRAEARLCGPEADPYPLAVSIDPPAASSLAPRRGAAPSLAVRHVSDDLCVRFWPAS